MQDNFGMVMAGFAVRGSVFFGNSGAFNTDVLGGHEFNGYDDVYKYLNDKEAQLVIGAFEYNFAQGWRTGNNDWISIH